MIFKTIIRCGTLYIIECKEIIEIYDEAKLIARPENITIIANEHETYDWHGSMAVEKNTNDMEKLSIRKGFPLLVMFNCAARNYRGLIKIIEEPRDLGKFYWLEFQGIDVLQAK
jgi:hypothetical protein